MFTKNRKTQRFVGSLAIFTGLAIGSISAVSAECTTYTLHGNNCTTSTSANDEFCWGVAATAIKNKTPGIYVHVEGTDNLVPTNWNCPTSKINIGKPPAVPQK